jgi:hypothetical protein
MCIILHLPVLGKLEALTPEPRSAWPETRAKRGETESFILDRRVLLGQSYV